MKERVLQKKSAFLLIEQLMALAIFAVSLLLISGVYQVLMKVQNKLEVPNYIEWHLMATQVDTHLQGFVKTKVSYDVEFLSENPKDKGDFKFRAEPKKGDTKARLWIEKNGGTHFVLIGYEKMLLHGEKDGVRLKGTLRNNEKFETYFIPGNRVISLKKEVIEEEKSTSSKEKHKKEETHDEKAAIVPKDKS